MTTMQRQKVQSFDMWHDYMELGRLLQRLSDNREESPKREAATWSHIQTSSRRQTSSSRSSVETSSTSSLSDTSCNGTSSDCCRFCKQNGESPRVYRSHRLKSDDGNVCCPILWSYTCPICAATGDRAHTRRYCPQAERGEAVRMLPAAGSSF
ncbi:nanos homolog 2-like [Sebastes umbrosus]|uniref:nanos homolog 2-like n=1 Tax=Sebastes umbrosus TaxID=72105 RepID=UPI0018A11664|nr:nanos homolog 2-like [Sebastes umbrosus]